MPRMRWGGGELVPETRRLGQKQKKKRVWIGIKKWGIYSFYSALDGGGEGGGKTGENWFSTKGTRGGGATKLFLEFAGSKVTEEKKRSKRGNKGQRVFEKKKSLNQRA